MFVQLCFIIVVVGSELQAPEPKNCQAAYFRAAVLSSDRRCVHCQVEVNAETETHTFLALWLLENDRGRHQAGTGNRLGRISDIPSGVTIASAHIQDDELLIEWDWPKVSPNKKGNVALPTNSRFSVGWLLQHSYSPKSLQRIKNQRNPSKFLVAGSEIPSVEYADWNTERGLWQTLQHISETGLCLIKGAPVVGGTVKTVAERIATISHTQLYGDIFDVRVEPNAINIAYTNAHLDPHMDLIYYESPPGLQLLHCIEFDIGIVGGNSTFVDAFLAADDLRRRNPASFDTLRRIPATFQKDHVDRARPAQMFWTKPHIALNNEQEVTAVHWAPPFHGPLRVPYEDVDSYYSAYREFEELILEEPRLVQFRLSPGDIIVFNQRRMLHGRTAFDNTASTGSVLHQRHLQGTYVNIDDFVNKLRVLNLKYNPQIYDASTTRVGNGDYG